MFDLKDNQLYLIKRGTVNLMGDSILESIEAGDFFGEASIFFCDGSYPVIQASEESEIYQLPIDTVKHIPILNWKLFERHEKRKKLFFHES